MTSSLYTRTHSFSSFDSSVPRVVSIDLEKEDHADIVNDILAAQLNLVNILAPESSQVRFNDEENTYTGVYGDFCQLNFGAHKQDPSSGMFIMYIQHTSVMCDVSCFTDLHVSYTFIIVQYPCFEIWWPSLPIVVKQNIVWT